MIYSLSSLPKPGFLSKPPWLFNFETRWRTIFQATIEMHTTATQPGYYALGSETLACTDQAPELGPGPAGWTIGFPKSWGIIAQRLLPSPLKSSCTAWWCSQGHPRTGIDQKRPSKHPALSCHSSNPAVRPGYVRPKAVCTHEAKVGTSGSRMPNRYPDSTWRRGDEARQQEVGLWTSRL